MGAKNAKSSSSLNKDDVTKLHSLVKGKLSEEEIQACYKAYQEGRNSKKNDELNRDEFKKVYSALFQCESEELADHVFRSFDVNNDGHVNFQEFLLGLCLSGSSDAETKITWAFKVYDIDGDGTISWAEMRNIIQKKTICLSFHYTYNTFQWSMTSYTKQLKYCIMLLYEIREKLLYV
ncbi:hypothetical protein ACF0H5_005225 [Mactra antiquata]